VAVGRAVESLGAEQVIKSLCMSDLARTLFAANELLKPLAARTRNAGAESAAPGSGPE
jgi:hypothetical protein